MDVGNDGSVTLQEGAAVVIRDEIDGNSAILDSYKSTQEKEKVKNVCLFRSQVFTRVS